MDVGTLFECHQCGGLTSPLILWTHGREGGIVKILNQAPTRVRTSYTTVAVKFCGTIVLFGLIHCFTGTQDNLAAPVLGVCYIGSEFLC